MHLIANNWFAPVTSRPVEIFDDHIYTSPKELIARQNQYDNFDRSGPKRYVGEYAVTSDCGHGNLRAALAEAVYMNGLERNSDIVVMASYAPLLENTRYKAWNPNAIIFNSSQVYGTPSYWVQCLYSTNRPDVLLPVDCQAPTKPVLAHGRIGLGTWETQAEFKDLKVTHGNETLLQPDVAADPKSWQFAKGDWKIEEGILRQTTNLPGTLAYIGSPDWTDCTISVRARKISGGEGFRILFDDLKSGPAGEWTIGGWGNTKYAVWSKGLERVEVPGYIEPNRWYDLRVELQGDAIRCYLDGKLIHDVRRTATKTLWTAAGKTTSGDVIIKAVNVGDTSATTTVLLDGPASSLTGEGTATVLTSGSDADENSHEHPTRVAPKQVPLEGVGKQFDYTFPANSVTVLRIKTTGSN
jgi:alpha-L-arabinofuranosidase